MQKQKNVQKSFPVIICSYQMCVHGQTFYDLYNWKHTAVQYLGVFFHLVSTLLLSLRTLSVCASFRSQGQVDSSLKQIPALPVWVSRV